MADAIIQVGADGVGKKLQTKENVIGINSVHSEAVFLTNDDGTSVNPNKEATQVLAEAHLGTIDTSTATIAGDTTSLDGKVTACNTGAVTVAVSALPAGASTEATLATVHGHVDALDAELVLVHAHIGTIDTAIGEINGHIHSLDAKFNALPTYIKKTINAQADGDWIALSAGKKLRVHQMTAQAIDTSSGQLRTNNVGGAILWEWSFAAREGCILPFSEVGWFESAAGEAIYADFVVGAETTWTIVYSEV